MRFIKELQRTVGVNDDFTTVLGYSFGDYFVLVELRLLVGAVEQVLNAAKTVNQSTSGPIIIVLRRKRLLPVSLLEQLPELSDRHLGDRSRVRNFRHT